MAGPVYRSSLLMLAAALLHFPEFEKNDQNLSSFPRGCAAAHGARAVMYRSRNKMVGVGFDRVGCGG